MMQSLQLCEDSFPTTGAGTGQSPFPQFAAQSAIVPHTLERFDQRSGAARINHETGVVRADDFARATLI